MADQDKPEELPDEIPRKKWWLWPVGGLVILTGLGFVGKKAYGRLEPERLSRKAKVMIDQGEYRAAMITLSRALQINNNSKTATEMMAQLMEKMQFPSALEWHRRMTELSPGSATEPMNWAEFALKEGKTDVATKALENVPAEARSTADFQNAAGIAAIRSGKWKAARAYFAEAMRLDPDNDMHRYNHALAELQSPEPADRERATTLLLELSQKGSTQVHAYRALVPRLTKEGKLEEALEKNAALTALPGAEFKDWLTQAELERHLKRDAWPQTLETAKAKAVQKEADVAVMVNWLRLNQREAEALEWAAKLDPAITESPLVRVARAECLIKLKRWEDLRRLTSTDPWGLQEFRRLAFLSLAQFHQDERVLSAASWTEALQRCRGDRGRLGQLAISAADWGWIPQTREALWAAADSPSPDWALQTLYRSYLSFKDTAEAARVARRMVMENPDDRGARNNVALFSVLLGRDLKEALATSAKLVAEQPDNPIFTSTHSIALLANGEPEESLSELERLKPEQRNDPAYAPYFAIAYHANGDFQNAREFLGKVDRSKLLPEEEAWMLKLDERLVGTKSE